MTQRELVREVFSLVIAAVMIIGGGVMLFISRAENNTDFQLVIAGFIGGAVQWVFGQQTAASTARAVERASATATAAAANGGTG